ncbi:MAG: DUF4405 domain-containing protein [Candidatus Woesearchaeota archaeon]|nr:DUF4405 domain-containing protein [Candidatus Woesearchaeota archaeon]
MANSKINYLIDILMVFSFLTTAFTSIILFFVIPSGPRAGQFAFLGAPKHVWVALHNYIGLAFILLMSAHIILHFKWLVSMTSGFFGKKSR